MLDKLHNNAFLENIYNILRDSESLSKICADRIDGEYVIRYQRNSKETVYYNYKSKEKMDSDFNNFITLYTSLYDKGTSS